MDKAGSDLRAVLGTIDYTVYTESPNPGYKRMVLRQGKDQYDIRFSGETLTINGVASGLIDIPRTVDSVSMY